MNRIALVLMLLCLPLPAAANGVHVAVEIQPCQLYVGDKAEVTITISSLDAVAITTSEWPEEIWDFTVLESITTEQTNLLGIKSLVCTYTIVPFVTGTVEVPQLDVQIIDAAGKSQVLKTPKASFLVFSVTEGSGENAQIRGLKEIARPEPEKTSVWIWIGGIGLLTMIILAVVIFLLRRRQPASLRKLISMSPAERALKDLKELLDSGLLAGEEIKKFYTALSFILRRYLGLRYHIRALEMTSSELSLVADGIWFEEEEQFRPILSEILKHCDLVKFAQHRPAEEEGFLMAEDTRRIIVLTRDDIPPVEIREIEERRSL